LTGTRIERGHRDPVTTSKLRLFADYFQLHVNDPGLKDSVGKSVKQHPGAVVGLA
jgi:hypothetical protein